MFSRLLFCSSSGRGSPSTALRGYALATRMGDACGFAPPFCFVAFTRGPLHSFLWPPFDQCSLWHSTEQYHTWVHMKSRGSHRRCLITAVHAGDDQM